MEIEKNPKFPQLSTRAITLLTTLCFRKDSFPDKVDGIFVFSSVTGLGDLATLVENLLERKISKQLFITGGHTPKTTLKLLELDKTTQSESEMLLSRLVMNKYPDVTLFTENQSTNTLENVIYTTNHKEFQQCESLLYIFKSHACGRGYLTLKKYLPNTQLYQKSFNPLYPKETIPITKTNWYTHDFGKSRVYGEFLRIAKYGRRGDIEFESVAGVVEELEKEMLK